MALKLSSSYAEGLNKEAKTRYLAKIVLINGIDPFAKSKETFDGVPPVEDCDFVSYLVLQTSFISRAQFCRLDGHSINISKQSITIATFFPNDT